MNKHFIQYCKKFFDSENIEIKQTQLYEIFSQLNGEKNWNIAKTKHLNFHSLWKNEKTSNVKKTKSSSILESLEINKEKIIKVCSMTSQGKTLLLTLISLDLMKNNKKISYFSFDEHPSSLICSFLSHYVDKSKFYLMNHPQELKNWLHKYPQILEIFPQIKNSSEVDKNKLLFAIDNEIKLGKEIILLDDISIILNQESLDSFIKQISHKYPQVTFIFSLGLKSRITYEDAIIQYNDPTPDYPTINVKMNKKSDYILTAYYHRKEHLFKINLENYNFVKLESN